MNRIEPIQIAKLIGITLPIIAGGILCYGPTLFPQLGVFPCVFVAVLLFLWIVAIAVWNRFTVGPADPRGIFRSLLIASVLMAVAVIGPSIYHLIHEAGVSALYAIAASLLLADFGGILFLVANAVKEVKTASSNVPSQDTSLQDTENQQREHIATFDLDALKPLVLYMGLAAGAAVGIFVGIDGFRRSLAHVGEERIYTVILDSFGLAAVSGILIAVFVTVGMLVFIFEHKVRHFTDYASSLVGQVQTLSDRVENLDEKINLSSESVKTATAQLTTVGPQIVSTSHDLSILANTLLDVPRIRKSRVILPITAEAYYLRSWISQMPVLSDPGADFLADVVREIAASYWIEETSDISRFELVTNSRNYTAFLIAAVTVLKRVAKQGLGKVHFYTSTPVGPRSLLNWPMRDYSGQEEIHYHADKDFVSSYMLFIRDMVKNDRDWVFHRRWIWTDVKECRGDYNRFSSWSHYEQKPIDEIDFFNDSTYALGVPVQACNSTKDFFERTIKCHNQGTPKAHVWDAWYNNIGSKKVVYPLLMGRAFESAIAERIIDTKKTVCDSVGKLLPTLILAARALADRAMDGAPGLLRAEEIEFVSSINEAILKAADADSLSIELRGTDEILMAMQKLDAALHLGGSKLEGDNDVKNAILEVESGLRWLKWWQFWQTEYPTGTELPLFRDYFSSAFQTDGKPHSADLADLANGLLACQETGPEFALLGLETEDSPDTHLKDGPTVRWLVALKSSISEPWDSGTITLVLRGNPRFQSYVNAIQALCGSAGLLKSTGV